eukprot:5825639-Pyramimonas_sp.AAC.2
MQDRLATPNRYDPINLGVSIDVGAVCGVDAARFQGVPIGAPATSDKFYFMTPKHRFPLPTPPSLHNRGNYLLSLRYTLHPLATYHRAPHAHSQAAR